MKLNLKAANELFEREAVYNGTHDVVPYNWVVELFGKDAADKARTRGGYNFNLYSNVMYFYYRGFIEALAYANMQTMLEEQANGGVGA